MLRVAILLGTPELGDELANAVLHSLVKVWEEADLEKKFKMDEERCEDNS